MIPEGNNVYGIITAPQGLEPILRAVEQVVGAGRASIYQWQFNGSTTLHLRSESADFESDHLDDGVQHLFSGSVGGSLEKVVAFVRLLSESLSRSGIEHSFEVYDDQQLVQRIPGRAGLCSATAELEGEAPAEPRSPDRLGRSLALPFRCGGTIVRRGEVSRCRPGRTSLPAGIRFG